MYCLLVMLLGMITWLVGTATVAFMLMIVGGATAVSAGCALKLDWFD